MDPSGYTRRIDLMMRMDRQLQRVYFLFGGFVLVAGLGVGMVGLFFSAPFLTQQLAGFGELAIKVAGFGTSTLSFLPFKQYWAVRERLAILDEMKRTPDLLDQGQADKMLNDLFMKRMGA